MWILTAEPDPETKPDVMRTLGRTIWHPSCATWSCVRWIFWEGNFHASDSCWQHIEKCMLLLSCGQSGSCKWSMDPEPSGASRVLYRTGKTCLHPKLGQTSFWKLMPLRDMSPMVLGWFMLSRIALEAKQVVSVTFTESDTLAVTWSWRHTRRPWRWWKRYFMWQLDLRSSCSLRTSSSPRWSSGEWKVAAGGTVWLPAVPLLGHRSEKKF